MGVEPRDRSHTPLHTKQSEAKESTPLFCDAFVSVSIHSPPGLEPGAPASLALFHRGDWYGVSPRDPRHVVRVAMLRHSNISS